MVEMLKVLSGYLNFEFETRKRVKAALTYPAIMAMMAVTATSILMFFVLPRFTRIYDAKGAALPKLTQILVGISKMFSDPQTTMTVLTTLMLAAMGLYYWVSTVPGRKMVDYIKINTPVIGTMFVDVLVTRSMRIMATMLNTGVSLLDAITVIQGSCKNYYFQQLWSQAKDKIHDGYQLSESLQISMDQGRTRAKLIAPGIIQMLKAGEKGGNLGMVSDKISDFYEDKLKGSIKTVTALIEPIMIIVMGSIIGTIAIALLMPVFKISTVMGR